MQNRLIHTSQTGGQLYNDTYPFSIPALKFASQIRKKRVWENTLAYSAYNDDEEEEEWLAPDH